jgi:hypothetical protein
MPSNPRNLQRVFHQAFSVRDLARPLISFDATTSAESIRETLKVNGDDLAGIRENGVLTHFVRVGELTTGVARDCAHLIPSQLVVPDSLPLAQLVSLLSEHPILFVELFGQPAGIVRREDMNQPSARMWLFGMITLLEMRFSRMIGDEYPGDSWAATLSEGRLSKAEFLLTQRRRHSTQVTLSDCLQFSDKVRIIGRSDRLRGMTRFGSRRQIEEIGTQLERLRNSLAHSQDVVTEDWDTIVALANNLTTVIEGPSEQSVDDLSG